MTADVAGRRPALAGLLLVSLAGAADVGLFIATDPGTALKTGGRATGSLAGLAVWLLLIAVSVRRLAGDDRSRLAPATVALASLAAAGGLGLAVIHQLAGVGGLRTVGGGLAGVVALGLALGARRAAQD